MAEGWPRDFYLQTKGEDEGVGEGEEAEEPPEGGGRQLEAEVGGEEEGEEEDEDDQQHSPERGHCSQPGYVVDTHLVNTSINHSINKLIN